MLPELAKLSSADEKVALLKECYPAIYVAFLNPMKRTRELRALYSGEVTTENMKWYINIELLPKLTKMHRENRLLRNQTKKIKIHGTL